MGLWLKTANGLIPVGGNGAYLTVTPWTNITFTSPWANYGGFSAGQYRKFGDKTELVGLLKITTGSIAPATASTITTLPVGFRPPNNAIFSSVMYTGSANQPCQIRVSSAGVVTYTTDTGGTLTTTGWVVLDGITFSNTAVNGLPSYAEVPQKPTWVTYTPVVTVVSGTNPNIGTIPTTSGAWMLDPNGICFWNARIAAGGTGVTAGTGNYQLSMPPNAVLGSQIVGTGWFYGINGFKQITIDTAGSAQGRIIQSSGAFLTQADGFMSGGTLEVSGWYRV